MRIAITGATGFVGSHLIKHLLESTEHHIVAISRSLWQSHHDRLEVRQADIYSLLDCENALKDCDVGIYLVHSMSPSSRLSQGTFEDFDFILADNFAKAAEVNQLQQVIYVSGLIGEKKETSVHLRSRLEVENTFMAHGTPSTTFRCGIILGSGGSSFTMVQRLVERLPSLVIPSWAQTLTQGVFIDDVVEAMTIQIQVKSKIHQSFDLVGTEKVPYYKILQEVARQLGKKRLFIFFPWVPIFLSKLWVRVITGYSKDLVYPLIESLKHPMLGQEERLWRFPNQQNRFANLEESVRLSLYDNQEVQLPMQRKGRAESPMTVQSVQRLRCPQDWTMKQVAAEYMHWLPEFLSPLFRIDDDNGRLEFRFRFISKPLLVLEFSEERTFKNRELFYIVDGLLNRPRKKARLEFRESPDPNYFIVAIHDFEPSLPWYIYRYSQALVHKWVMKFFGRHLNRL